jgi:tetratricopeptide (TPR) repeat protein
MKQHHPDQEVLIQLRRGELAPEDQREVERHLSQCADCREKVDEVEILANLDVLESWLHPGYDEAIERAADRVSERLTDLLGEARDTDVLFTELFRQPPPERRALIRRDPRLHSVKLCQKFQSRSREMWSSDPSAALENAELAVEIAERLDRTRYGSDLVEDARATAWAYVGNSYRVSSDLWKAERALRRAWMHHTHAGEDPYTEGELLSFLASLRYSQTRITEASRILDRAIAIYRESQDRQLESRALIQKGTHLAVGGEHEEAIRLIHEGLRRAGADIDPLLTLVSQHNLIYLLNESGLPDKASEQLARKRGLYAEYGNQLHRINLRWLEGQIAQNLGDLKAAEAAFRETREMLLDQRLGVRVACISLELMLLHAKQGQTAEILEEAAVVIPFFDSCGLARKAAAARLLFEKAKHL